MKISVTAAGAAGAFALSAIAGTSVLPAQSAVDRLAESRSSCVKIAPSSRRGIVGLAHDDSGSAVPFAVVGFNPGADAHTVSDQHGCFYLGSDKDGARELVGRRIGYKPTTIAVQIPKDSAAFADLVLNPIATMIDGVSTVAPPTTGLALTGFYDRLLDRKRGLGSATFFTPEELDKRNDHVTDVIAGAVGVRLISVSDGYLVPMSNSAKGPCAMEIWIDGTRVTGLGALRPPATTAGRGPAVASALAPDIDALVPITNIAGIEVYTRPSQVPAQYQSVSNGCGAIVMWTKR